MNEKTYEKGRAWIEIDRNNLALNVNTLRGACTKNCELMPAVKADAYGHGAVLISKELNRLGVQAFCVATVMEGVQLRNNGVTGMILILGYTAPEQFELLNKFELTQTVVDFTYAKKLAGVKNPVNVHIAVDTGMHRIGELSDHVEEILQIFRIKQLHVTGIFTHLCADDTMTKRDRDYTMEQAKRFWNLVSYIEESGYHPKAHILSSYGVINYPELGGDYARVGIALYGVLSTGRDTKNCNYHLRPVLSVRVRVASVRKLKKGENAGYGLAYTAKEDSVIATLAIGYGDGLPRELSCGKGNVILHGKKVPIIGRICMDQTMVDVSLISEVQAGDIATVIGKSGSEEISVCDIAEQSNTITNEILSQLGARLPRIQDEIQVTYSGKIIRKY